MATTGTIHEAVKIVLQDAGKPCTLDEILHGLTSRQLYAFRVASARGVVRQAIRRRCQGYSNLDRAGEPLFREIDGGRYVLVQ